MDVCTSAPTTTHTIRMPAATRPDVIAALRLYAGVCTTPPCAIVLLNTLIAHAVVVLTDCKMFPTRFPASSHVINCVNVFEAVSVSPHCCHSDSEVDVSPVGGRAPAWASCCTTCSKLDWVHVDDCTVCVPQVKFKCLQPLDISSHTCLLSDALEMPHKDPNMYAS